MPTNNWGHIVRKFFLLFMWSTVLIAKQVEPSKVPQIPVKRPDYEVEMQIKNDPNVIYVPADKMPVDEDYMVTIEIEGDC
jgi:hypothetical protein